jgi:D-alanyl-lipoteichoic acid acyltransferase DltB (MBOAT superfamily)
LNFASLDYLLFLVPLYVLLWGRAWSKVSRHLLLLLSSLFFYSYGSGLHLLLLIYSACCDQGLSLAIQASKERGRSGLAWLWLSIVNNVGLLFVFKYHDAIVGALGDAFGFDGGVPWDAHGWLLPIGISFYTFQTLSYTLDVYEGRIKPCSSLLDYLLYVSFFPQLVAGPILRASQFLPQLLVVPTFCRERFFQGVMLICLGLIKKVVIADSLGVLVVDPVYASPSPSGLDVLQSTFLYAFQIYNDFSGYSDIAIGSACLLGYRVPINFDRPFSCNNPMDFWNRWHISLSHWVRDYLFYPLMMKRSFFKSRVLLNIFLTTVIIGVWHGAGLNFLCFGVLHGVLAVVYQMLSKKLAFKTMRGGAFLLSWLIYWLFLNLGMLLFRSHDGQHIKVLLSEIFQGSWLESQISWTPYLVFVCCLAILTHLPRAKTIQVILDLASKRAMWCPLVVVWSTMLLVAMAVSVHQGRAAFIYFRF